MIAVCIQYPLPSTAFPFTQIITNNSSPYWPRGKWFHWTSKVWEIMRAKKIDTKKETRKSNLGAVGGAGRVWRFSAMLAPGANGGEGKADEAERRYRCQSTAKSAICGGEWARRLQTCHARSEVRQSGWQVIKSRDVSFERDQLLRNPPADINGCKYINI